MTLVREGYVQNLRMPVKDLLRQFSLNSFKNQSIPINSSKPYLPQSYFGKCF